VAKAVYMPAAFIVVSKFQWLAPFNFVEGFAVLWLSPFLRRNELRLYKRL